MHRLVLKRLPKFVTGFSLALAVIVFSGCQQDAGGPALAKSAGTVTYKGAPVSGAAVTFIYESGEVSSGVTDDLGKFSMSTGGREGAPIGKAKVTISKVSSTGERPKAPADMKPEDMMKMGPTSNPGARPGDFETSKNELPEKYASPDSSGFNADVIEGANNDFTYKLVD